MEEDLTMSRDVGKDKPQFHWWEPFLYLAILSVMFWLEINFLQSNLR